MSRNYANLSPKNEQRHRRNQSSPKSGYFVLLLLIIVGITSYYVFSRGILFSKNRADIAPAVKEQEAAPKPKKPRFEFYTLLSQETVPVHRDKNEANAHQITADATTSPDEAAQEAEAKKKKAEEEKKALEAREITENSPSQANKTAEVAPSGVPSLPIQVKHTTSSPAPVTHAQETPTPPKQQPKTTISATPTNAENESLNMAKSNRYVLQVAALQRISDADQLKAKLSFLGFNVLVEPFQRNGVTWYRVKTGPFLSQEAMQKARQVLMNNHLSGIVITLPPG